jgi:hypothetical protein
MILKDDGLALTAAGASAGAHVAAKRSTVRYRHVEADFINFSYSLLVAFRLRVGSVFN